MSDFVKVTSEKNFLTGAQKAAILLGELGRDASKPILSYLNLPAEKIRKINIAMASLGQYDAQNKFQVQRELSVLNEAAAFGKTRAIWKEAEMPMDYQKSDRSSSTKEEISESTKIIAETIRSWLKDSDE